ncbi:MAG: (Fe-S)-binding protein, partial [Natronospirillum sp.]
YYSRYLRPLKDYFIGGLEFMIPWLARVRPVYNLPMQLPPVQWLLKHVAGMVDSPLISRTHLNTALRQHNIPLATAYTLSQLSPEERAHSVILVQDAFTSFFETDTVVDFLEAYRLMGFNPLVMPYLPNGKPLHVHGFHNAFAATAKKQALWLRGLSSFKVPFVGVDPSMVLAFRSEYRALLGDAAVPDVLLPQEYLATHLPLQPAVQATEHSTWYLLAHCTESTNAAPSIQQWQQVYQRLGLTLKVLSVGCCGMAGTYGHETRNRTNSEVIYDLSWRALVENPAYRDRLVATGYSCRSQSQRLSGATLPHPLKALKEALTAAQPIP